MFVIPQGKCSYNNIVNPCTKRGSTKGADYMLSEEEDELQRIRTICFRFCKGKRLSKEYKGCSNINPAMKPFLSELCNCAYFLSSFLFSVFFLCF